MARIIHLSKSVDKIADSASAVFESITLLKSCQDKISGLADYFSNFYRIILYLYRQFTIRFNSPHVKPFLVNNGAAETLFPLS